MSGVTPLLAGAGPAFRARSPAGRVRRVLACACLAALVAAGCGGRNPAADAAARHPGASECLSWKGYVLIRYPENESTHLRPAVLMRVEGEQLVELGRSNDGFLSLNEVMTYLPELDESGVEAFGLR